MKRFAYILSAVLAGTALPIFVFAQFQGPTQSPPNGNVPGVIWNTAGTGVVQPGAQINIDGDITSNGALNVTGNISGNDLQVIGDISAKGDFAGQNINAGGNLKSAGDISTRSVSTTWSHDNALFGNLILQPGKAFHIDQNGPATYWMGNWGGAGGASKALSLSLNGDFYAYAFAPSGAGQEGRIQADKFCFHPGAPSDCITSWSLNSGLYVQKIGDAMTGALSITVPTGATGLTVSGGAVGANISGSLTGLQVSGGNYGAYISSGSQYGTWLSYPSYGTYITVPATSNYGLYVSAAAGLSGSQQSGIYADVPVATVGLSTAGRLEAAGDLDVATNKWGGPNSGNFTTRYQQSVGGVTQWSDYVPSSYKCATKNTTISSAGYYTCPNGTYMGGVQVNASQQVTNLVCCTL